jgi:hypothetical protein
VNINDSLKKKKKGEICRWHWTRIIRQSKVRLYAYQTAFRIVGNDGNSNMFVNLWTIFLVIITHPSLHNALGGLNNTIITVAQ